MERYDSMLRTTLLNIYQIIQLLQGDLKQLIESIEAKELKEMTPAELSGFQVRLRNADFTAGCLSNVLMEAVVSSSPETGNSRTEKEKA